MSSTQVVNLAFYSEFPDVLLTSQHLRPILSLNSCTPRRGRR